MGNSEAVLGAHTAAVERVEMPPALHVDVEASELLLEVH